MEEQELIKKRVEEEMSNLCFLRGCLSFYFLFGEIMCHAQKLNNLVILEIGCSS